MPIEYLDEMPSQSTSFEYLDDAQPDDLTMQQVVEQNNLEVRDAAEKAGLSMFGEFEWANKVNKGKIGMWEAATEFTDLIDLTPVAGSQYRATKNYQATEIAAKLQAGEEPTESEIQLMREVIGKRAEADARGFTVGGQIAIGVTRMPAYMLEFALSRYGGKYIGKISGLAGSSKKATEAAGTIGGMAAIRGPESFRERRVNEYMSVTDKGELFIKEAQESPFVSALKALGDTGVESVSEMAGGPIGKYAVGPVTTAIKKPVMSAFQKLPVGARDALFKAYKAVKPNATVKDVMTKAGFHGMLNEMGEERVSSVLRAALNLNDEGYSVDAILKQIVPSAEQLYVEAGIFSIAGATSTSASMIMNRMQKNGYSRQEAEEQIRNMSATEHDSFVSDILKEGRVEMSVPRAGVSEPPVAEGMVRVYHSGAQGEGETGRWVSTNKKYASDYRPDLPLFYLDIPANDPRVQSDYEDQGVNQGFTFNFELTPEESSDLKEIDRGTQTSTSPSTRTTASKQEALSRLENNFSDQKQRRVALIDFLEAEGKSREESGSKAGAFQDDPDRKLARLIDEDLKNLPGVVYQALIYENALDQETGETINAGTDRVTGTHIFNLRQIREDLMLDEAAGGDTPPPPTEPPITDDAGEPIEIKIDNSESLWAKLYRDWLDDLSPIEKLTKAYEEKEGKLAIGENPNFLARLYAATKGRILQNIQNQTYYQDKDGKNVITGEGLKSILDDFDAEFENIEPDYDKRQADLKDYLIARRYQEDLQNRDDVEVSDKQKEESIKTMARLNFKYGSEFVRLQDYAQRIYDFQARILMNLVSSGILSQKKYDDILAKNPNYIPFQRIFEEEEISEDATITSLGKFEGRNPLKKIEGSERDVKDPLQSIVKNTSRVLQAAARNRVALSIVNIGKAFPEQVQKAAAPMKKINLPDGEETYRPAGKPFGNVIEYYENGKRKYIEVAKPLYEAMIGMHPRELNVIEKIVTGIGSFFKAAATLPPDFWVRNFMRDIVQAFVQSKKGVTPIDIIKGITAVSGKTELYDEWMRSGGSFNSYMDLDDKGMEKAMKELLRPNGRAMRYAKSLGLEALKDAAGAVEQTTRVAVFSRAMGKGLSPMEAAYESRDATLDFSRAGRLGRIANRYIIFLNPALQGTDKLIRAAKSHPESVILAGLASITLPSIFITGYYLYGAPDDERKEYLEIPQWQKDMFWCFKVGEEWRRIPKPFALGYAFGSVPERFMMWSYEGDKPEAEHLWREVVMGLGGSLSPVQDVSAFLTPAGKIIFESMTNYNFFTGRQIYPSWMDRLPPEDRVKSTTTETAKTIGKAAGVSPALIDNAIRGALATSTPYVMSASDGIVKAVKEWNGETLESRPKTDADTLFIRAFSVRRPSGTEAVSTQNFYNKYSKVEQIYNGLNKRKGKERKEYMEKHADEIRAYKGMANFYEKISDIKDRQDRVYDSDSLSDSAKIKQVQEMDDRIVEIAKKANEWYKLRSDANQ